MLSLLGCNHIAFTHKGRCPAMLPKAGRPLMVMVYQQTHFPGKSCLFSRQRVHGHFNSTYLSPRQRHPSHFPLLNGVHKATSRPCPPPKTTRRTKMQTKTKESCRNILALQNHQTILSAICTAIPFSNCYRGV